MSGFIIQIDYDQAERIAQDFAHEGDATDKLIRSIQHCVDELESGGWIGQAAQRFYAEMNHEIFPAMLRLAQAMHDASVGVRHISSILRQAEEEAAQLFSRMDSLFQMPQGVGGGQASAVPDINSAFEAFKKGRQPYNNPEVGYPRDQPDKWMAQYLMFYRKDITQLEADALDKLSILEQSDLKDIHDEAFLTEKLVFGAKPNNDGLGDAFRHTYWSARMTQEFGAGWTKEFTDAHESKTDNPAARDFMDRHNNALGIRIAQEHPDASQRELAGLISQAVQNGEAVYIPNADQYGIKSPERAALIKDGPVAYTNQHPDAGQIKLNPDEPSYSDTSSVF